MCVCVQGFIQDFEFWEREHHKVGVDVKGRGVWGHVHPEFFFFLIDAQRLVLGVLVVSSKREVYTARLSFI